MRRSSVILRSLHYFALAITALLVLFPLIWALAVSLMTPSQVNAYPPALVPASPQWSNYAQVVQSAPIGRFLLNSLLVAGSITLAQMATASLSAYAFAFMRFPGRTALFGLFMSTLMVPWEVTMIPNFLTVRFLGLLDTYAGLILPFAATAFGTFLLRQYFLQIPRDLEDAARIDGCGRLRFLWSVVLPLSRPGLITFGAYTFLSSWNQYLWPLLVTESREMRTAQIAVRFLMNEEARQYNVIMAGVILFFLPAALMLLWGQRYLARGLMEGAVKG